MTKQKLFKHVLPIILSAVLVFSALPMSVSAQNESTDKVASKIVREVTELREESVKHFLCEDGSYIAATYSQPVHYQVNGSWVEIDNSLQLSGKVISAAGEPTYTPKAADTAVSIPRSFTGGQQITAENKGHTISFGVASQNPNVALEKSASVVTADALPSAVEQISAASSQTVSAASAAALNAEATAVADTAEPELSETEQYNLDMMAVENQAGAVVFEDVFPGSDLEYIVNSSSIKENIVVYQQQSEYTYSFDFDIGGLTPVLEADGSIALVDSAKQNEVVFIIAAPYMYDASGAESLDVEMELTPNGDAHLLTVTADASWINSSERTFPVVIDPPIDFEFNDVFVMDGVLYEDTTRTGTELRVGRNLTNLTRTYIMPTVPTGIPTGSVVEDAQLVLKVKSFFNSTSDSFMYVAVRDCYGAASWSPSSVTWNNQPFDNSDNGYTSSTCKQICLEPLTSNTDTCTFDITESAQRWVNTGVCDGLMLASLDETEKKQVDFYSSRALLDSNHPQAYFTYSLPSVSTTVLNIGQASCESEVITVNAGATWTVSFDQPWISIVYPKDTDGFIIRATENTSAYERISTVTVKVGNTVIGTVTVTQFGSEPSLIVDKTSLVFDYKTSTDNFITVTSNADWDVSYDATWLNAEKVDSNTIKVSLTKENTSAVKNEAKITVSLTDFPNSTPKEITVTQYDKVTCLFNTINADGTLSAISSTEYNHALATWAMELSYAAYNYPTDTELPGIPGDFMGDVVDTAAKVLKDHGFAENQTKEYNYDVIYDESSSESEIDHTAAGAHTIAYRNIEYVPQNENTTEEEANFNGSNAGMVRSTVRGNVYDSVYSVNTNTNAVLYDLQLTEDEPITTRPLVVVTVRGSVTLNDWINNAITQLYPMDNRFATLKDEVAQNLTNDISGLSDPIILVTGHSLGAAIANLLAAELSAELGVEDVYAYTFATPQVVTESLGQVAVPYPNIFNILNSNDVVTYMPTTLIVPLANFWARHGIDIPINMQYDENLFTDPTGALCHSMAVYIAWMENNPDMTYESIMEESAKSHIRGILPILARIKCPVGVTVKDSEGNIIAYESQQEGITYPEITDTGIVSWIDDDGAKVFFIPYYADASKIEIDAYDYGNMTMTVGLLGIEEEAETDETDEISNRKTYNNVNLFPGRAFDVDLTEITEEVSMDDISLMEVEVDDAGNRTDIGEITDLNPLLKSATIDNAAVTYGTPSVFTVVTDKSVTKVQLIRAISGTTITVDKNSTVLVSLVEDGDNLIWTIQRVIGRGATAYNVGVKVGSTWYITENVFYLTVT